MPPDANFVAFVFDISDVVEQDGDVLGRAYVFDRHRQKLRGGIAVVAYRSRVHGKESKRLPVINPSGLRIVVEQFPVPLITLPYQFFGPTVLRDIARDFGETAQFTRLIP